MHPKPDSDICLICLDTFVPFILPTHKYLGYSKETNATQSYKFILNLIWILKYILIINIKS